MTADQGLRERKKLQTAARIVEVALPLFVEHGFDQVSVVQIAEAAEVSKMTVFNYFPRKEDIALAGSAAHATDLALAVARRAPGESVVAAVRRHHLTELAERAPQSGLSEHVVPMVRMIMSTPVLLTRLREIMRRGQSALADLLAADTAAGPDDLTPRLAAAQIAGVRDTLVEDNFRRLAAGEPVDDVQRTAVTAAELAFDLLERGLGGYGAR
ncbi:TetR family transcriptional regulator [Kitasatospora sp. NPDC088134]|uniref:TetR family transcriptional regulator n=1 Tax=Kitasatospora sp. NPDC088134 TaxID=3364071 RepID=UPI00382CF19C